MGLWVEGSNHELRVMGYDALVRGCGSGVIMLRFKSRGLWVRGKC